MTPPRSQRAAFGQGLYGMVELARLVAVQAQEPGVMSRVPYWVGRALTPGRHRPHRPDHGFHDLISLFVVRDLVRAGLKPRQIRVAEGYLQERLDHPRPFATERIYTDGVNVLYKATPKVADQLTAAQLEGQEVLRDPPSLGLRGVGYQGGEAAFWTPQTDVVLDPAIQFGDPCIAGTRIQTRQLAALHERGESTAALAADYEVPEQAVNAALAFERQLAQT